MEFSIHKTDPVTLSVAKWGNVCQGTTSAFKRSAPRLFTDGIGTEFCQALNSIIKIFVNVYNDAYKFHLDHFLDHAHVF